MLTSLVEVTKAIAAPALSKALFGLCAYAYAGADTLEVAAHKLARTARDAAAPVQPEVVTLDRVVTLGELLQIAQDEGRVVYAP